MNFLQKFQIKGFFAGILVMALISTATVFAAARTEAINVTFDNIRLVVNGEEITPRDANGDVVEPFIWNGSTYLPIRAVGYALDLSVNWDASTNTAILGDAPAPATTVPAPEPAPEPEPDPTPEPTITGFAGTWNWLANDAYYVFNANGTGTMAGMPIGWTSGGGVLSICVTPDLPACQDGCIAPAEWYYVFDGNTLTLRSTILDDLVFTYTRAN